MPYRVDVQTTKGSDTWLRGNMEEIIELIRDLVKKGEEIEFIRIGKVGCKEEQNIEEQKNK